MNCSLFTDTKLFDQRTIRSKVRAGEVLQEAFAATYHLHESALAGEIFFIGFEVIGNMIDTLGKHSNLTLDRTGVRFVFTVSFKNVSLFFSS
jgi:hypothetical protein